MSKPAPESPPGVPEAESADAPLLLPFLLGAAGWFGSFGLQAVLFSTLLVVELEETASRVGAAQSALMLPSVVLVLFGGAFADRSDRRRLLMTLHIVAGVLVLGLAAMVATGRLTYGVLIGYALAMGTLQAFILPARDSLLSEVAGDDLGRAVASMNVTQWGSQALGALLASATRFVGPAAMLVVQSFLLFSGAPALSRLPAAIGRASTASERLSVGSLFTGIREVAGSSVLLPTLVLVMAVGILFVGPFQVVLPLMMRDTYGGGVFEIALVSTMFPFGTITGSLAIVARGGLRRKGRSQLAALGGGAVVLLVLASGLPLWGTVFGIWLWGIFGSVFMIAGRTTFQESALAASRGRVLATYTFGFMGAAGVVGAPLSGALVARFGPEQSLGLLGIAMLLVVASVGMLSTLRHIE